MNKINLTNKIKNIKNKGYILRLKKQGYKFFYIKGVFDLFHEGHYSFLEYINKKITKKYGSKIKIIISIESDRITKIKKGKNRPYDNENKRASNVLNSQLVDYVFISDDQARYLIKELIEYNIDYFVIPEEYIKHLNLFYIIKNKLKKEGIKVILSRHKQYEKYGINKNLSTIHTTGIENLGNFNKINIKYKHIIYLTKELLFLYLK